MQKLKPVRHKKTLVRNTEQPLPRTNVIYEYEEEPSEKQSQKRDRCPQDVENEKEKISLDKPRVNSTMKMKNQIKDLEKLYPVSSKNKALVESEKKIQFAAQGKSLKHLNFPHSKKLYRDLIPLHIGAAALRTKTVPTREPNPPKDKEPVLSDFVKSKPCSEYTYQVPIQKQERSSLQSYDGYRLYKLMSTWE